MYMVVRRASSPARCSPHHSSEGKSAAAAMSCAYAGVAAYFVCRPWLLHELSTLSLHCVMRLCLSTSIYALACRSRTNGLLGQVTPVQSVSLSQIFKHANGEVNVTVPSEDTARLLPSAALLPSNDTEMDMGTVPATYIPPPAPAAVHDSKELEVKALIAAPLARYIPPPELASLAALQFSKSVEEKLSIVPAATYIAPPSVPVQLSNEVDEMTGGPMGNPPPAALPPVLSHRAPAWASDLTLVKSVDESLNEPLELKRMAPPASGLAQSSKEVLEVMSDMLSRTTTAVALVIVSKEVAEILRLPLPMPRTTVWLSIGLNVIAARLNNGADAPVPLKTNAMLVSFALPLPPPPLKTFSSFMLMLMPFCTSPFCPHWPGTWPRTSTELLSS